MIDVKNLTKRYGKNIAIENLNFTVNKNEIVGFLGPNGAGKTTTMNIITGYIAPSFGDVLINNINIIDSPIKAKKIIGYLPDNPPLYPDMKVIEYLNFVNELKNAHANKNQIKEIIERLKISDVTEKLIRNLSKGYRQRVGLAQALIGNPEVLILDEPTSGLDPKQIIEMRNLIVSLKSDHTILLSSHILSEINAIADRVIIINKGKIVADNTPSQLSKNLMHGKKIIVRIRGNEKNILPNIEKNPKFKCIDVKKNVEPNCIDIVIENKNIEFDLREQFFNFAVENKLILIMMKPFDMSLEEVFLQVTNENQIDCEIEKTDEEQNNSDSQKNNESENKEVE